MTAEQRRAMETVHDFIKQAGTYYIASAEGDQPRVRPFGVIHIFEDKLYIQTGRRKKCYKQFVNQKVYAWRQMDPPLGNIGRGQEDRGGGGRAERVPEPWRNV